MVSQSHKIVAMSWKIEPKKIEMFVAAAAAAAAHFSMPCSTTSNEQFHIFLFSKLTSLFYLNAKQQFSAHANPA